MSEIDGLVYALLFFIGFVILAVGISAIVDIIRINRLLKPLDDDFKKLNGLLDVCILQMKAKKNACRTSELQDAIQKARNNGSLGVSTHKGSIDYKTETGALKSEINERASKIN